MKKIRFNTGYLFDIVIYLFLSVIFVITFYPFWNIFIISINEASDSIKGGLFLLPRAFTLDSYKAVLTDPEILTSVKVTVARTLIGTILPLFFTSMLAYALSRRELIGRKAITLVFIFTMYFGGGLIPYYMVVKTIGLIDSFWVYVFPGLISVFNMILIRSYIMELPGELVESSRIDGANDLLIYFKIILPLCTPVLATVGLFTAVGQWNSWFDSYILTTKPELKTLSAVLVKILNQYQTGAMLTESQRMANSMQRLTVTSESIRMTTTMVATIPIIMVYPFLQKYFVKGLLVGAIKD